MKTLISCLIGLLFILILGCKKNDQNNSMIYQNISALVLNYGDPSVDGCGWMVKTDKDIYSPVNLNNDYKKDSLIIFMDYEILSTTWNCGWRTPGYKEIQINKIRK